MGVVGNTQERPAKCAIEYSFLWAWSWQGVLEPRSIARGVVEKGQSHQWKHYARH